VEAKLRVMLEKGLHTEIAEAKLLEWIASQASRLSHSNNSWQINQKIIVKIKHKRWQ
jgi:hypothetical protein